MNRGEHRGKQFPQFKYPTNEDLKTLAKETVEPNELKETAVEQPCGEKVLELAHIIGTSKP